MTPSNSRAIGASRRHRSKNPDGKAGQFERLGLRGEKIFIVADQDDPGDSSAFWSSGIVTAVPFQFYYECGPVF